MLQQSIDDTRWHEVFAGMLTDVRFSQFQKFRWYGEVNGARVGVAVASRSAQYSTYALNKGHVEGLLAAKHNGKVDLAFIAAFNNGTFVAYHDAEEFHANVLAHLPTRSGQFGAFWSLSHFEVTGEAEPF